MRQVNGTRLYPLDRRPAARRAGRILPSRGEKWFCIGWPAWHYLLRWAKWDAMRVLSLTRPDVPGGQVTFLTIEEVREMGLKRRVPPAQELPLPALPSESRVLAKCPLLREFLSATAYEDGSPRTPGYCTLRPRFIEWEITLYDPDAGLRVAVRARTLDDVFAAAEVVLSASEAPWEQDHYLTEQLAKKAKSKKK